MSDWNQSIIDEFRANGGKVGGRFAGGTLLLLHHIGARTGIERVSPLAYFPDGDRMLVMASKGGAPTNPDWYHNLKANPRVKIEVGTETVEVEATELVGAEREAMWVKITARMPGFAAYEKHSQGRKIPVFALVRV